jgi:hypothetical protein
MYYNAFVDKQRTSIGDQPSGKQLATMRHRGYADPNDL